jgi:predicted enzyme related to lactoylglutathione lyase
MIDGFADMAVVVSDSKKAMKWYTEVLGLKLVFSRGHANGLAPNIKENTGIVLHVCGDNYAPMEPGNTGIAFTVDDLDKTVNELAKKGVKFTKLPTKDDFRYAMFSDPDGNEFWMFESKLAKQVLE